MERPTQPADLAAGRSRREFSDRLLDDEAARRSAGQRFSGPENSFSLLLVEIEYAGNRLVLVNDIETFIAGNA